MEGKTLEDICVWLEERGFSSTVVKAFKGVYAHIVSDKLQTTSYFNVLILLCLTSIDHELNGCAIAVGLGSNPGSGWLKDIIPSVGARLKVHHALRTLLNSGSSSVSQSLFSLY